MIPIVHESPGVRAVQRTGPGDTQSFMINGALGGLIGAIATFVDANADGDADKLPAFDPFAQEATGAI